jgi:hypothetical protein
MYKLQRYIFYELVLTNTIKKERMKIEHVKNINFCCHILILKTAKTVYKVPIFNSEWQ